MDNIANISLDEIDRRILTQLQNNARMTNADLAEEVGLSPSPCLRRVRDLEQNGTINRYVALISLAAVGLPVSVFVQVTLERQVEFGILTSIGMKKSWLTVMVVLVDRRTDSRYGSAISGPRLSRV